MVDWNEERVEFLVDGRWLEQAATLLIPAGFLDARSAIRDLSRSPQCDAALLGQLSAGIDPGYAPLARARSAFRGTG